MMWIVLDTEREVSSPIPEDDFEILDSEEEVIDYLQSIGKYDISDDDCSVLIYPYEEAHTVSSFRYEFGL